MTKVFELKGRRLSRALVMEALYRFDLLDEDPKKVLEEAIKRENLEENHSEFARILLTRVIENMGEIDNLIEMKSKNWELRRIQTLERAILRMGTGELLAMPDVPFKVTIHEAVELAKKFSGEEAGKFVNGILDAVAEELGLKEEK